jgi:hypothetical protein
MHPYIISFPAGILPRPIELDVILQKEAPIKSSKVSQLLSVDWPQSANGLMLSGDVEKDSRIY